MVIKIRGQPTSTYGGMEAGEPLFVAPAQTKRIIVRRSFNSDCSFSNHWFYIFLSVGREQETGNDIGSSYNVTRITTIKQQNCLQTRKRLPIGNSTLRYRTFEFNQQ
jgi:hypothetical protein